MNEGGNTRDSRRYVALDIHKHYCVIAGVDRERRVVLQPVRVEHADLEGWLKKNLCSTDQVVFESTSNAWHVYDLLSPLVERVVVANPIKVKQIASVRVKTDIRDTLILARLLAANLVPEVWVPPAHVRELRQLLSQRRQLVETHTQIVNRMHSLAHRHHLQHKRGKRFNEENTAWQKDKRLSKVEQFQLELEMENRAYIEKQISRIGKEVAKMSHRNPWAQDMTYLMQLPGFGVITGMTVLAAIGEIQRFESAKHLASYSGLTGELDQSGTKLVQKGITKEGRKELRWALVEIAQRAVKSDPRWTRKFQELHKRMHRNQAIVAVARQLLELVWHVLTRRQSYRYFSQERIAYKYLTWAWPEIAIVQVVKQRVEDVLRVDRRIIQGAEGMIAHLIKATQGKGVINTAFIERLNATFRQRIRSLTRRTRTLAQRAETLVTSMYLVGCFYNFCDFHHSLRLKLSVGSFGYRWVQRTPAIAAKLTDHQWTPIE